MPRLGHECGHDRTPRQVRQRVGEVTHGWPAVGRLAGQGLETDRVQARVEPGSASGGGRRVVESNLRNEGQYIALERPRTGKQLVENHAEAPHVAGGAHGGDVAGDLLGRHVGRRAKHLPLLGELGEGQAGAAGQAKIHQDRLAAAVDHHVAGLEVTVNDAATMGLVKGKTELADKCGSRVGFKGPRGIEVVRKRFAFDESHRQVRDAVDLAEVMDGADIGMVQRGGRLGLAEETARTSAAWGSVRTGTLSATRRPSWVSRAR